MGTRHEISDAVNKAAASLRSPKISETVANGLKGGGNAADSIGASISSRSRKTANDLMGKSDEVEASVGVALGNTSIFRDRPAAARAVGRFGAMLTKGVGLLAHTGTAVGGVIGSLGRGISQSGEAVGGAVGGLSKGAADFLTGSADFVLLTEGDIKLVRAELVRLGNEDRQAALQRVKQVDEAIRDNRRTRLLDLLMVGGMTLSAVLAKPEVSPQVQKAFELAYPNLASVTSFSEAVASYSNEGLTGFLAGVKGKLFEIQLVDHLNDGNLPDGLLADLASSPTQTGWDIQITDKQTGEVHELLQAKATESLSHVQDALNRYPDIDVVTTTEVHALLTARGLAEQARDGGVLNSDLEQQLEQAAAGGQGIDPSDYLPSGLAVAFIALSVLLSAKYMSAKQLGEKIGSRSAQATISAAAGKMALASTQVWLVAFAAGMGSHWLANNGRDKRLKLEALLESMYLMQKKVLRDARSKATDTGYSPASA